MGWIGSEPLKYLGWLQNQNLFQNDAFVIIYGFGMLEPFKDISNKTFRQFQSRTVSKLDLTPASDKLELTKKPLNHFNHICAQIWAVLVVELALKCSKLPSWGTQIWFLHEPFYLYLCIFSTFSFFYPLSHSWSFNRSCPRRLASPLELGSQVGSTTDHLSICCLNYLCILSLFCPSYSPNHNHQWCGVSKRDLFKDTLLKG